VFDDATHQKPLESLSEYNIPLGGTFRELFPTMTKYGSVLDRA
jgi:hypothetical protein